MHPYSEKVLKIVQQRNLGETVFLQAVNEVLETLDSVLEERPEFEELNLLDRICEPERQIVFRVPWQDDSGKIHVNRGFRTHFSSVLGPYKGGLRFHPTVNASIIKFLGFEQIFKNSLTGLYIGGGKGGSDFDPKGRTDNEVMRFCQSFMDELYRHVGPTIDVPAGDIGVGAREIGYLFGHYKRLTNRFDLGVLTGKNQNLGGSLGRKEATGYGCVYFAQEMLAAARGEEIEGKTCVVSGSGNVALYAIQKLQQLGGKVVACSESTGYLYDAKGLDLPLLIDLKEKQRGRLEQYLQKHPHATFKAGAKVWEVPCQLAFPCATQNEILLPDAKKMVEHGCHSVCEGANMPVHPEALHYFQSKGILFAPGKAANAGGVAVSALEMQQNACWDHWTFEAVDARLRDIMKRIHDTCIFNATKYDRPHNYVLGANIAGFLRVAEGMIAYGIV